MSQKKKRMIVNENKGNHSRELTKSDTVEEKKSLNVCFPLLQRKKQ